MIVWIVLGMIGLGILWHGIVAEHPIDRMLRELKEVEQKEMLDIIDPAGYARLAMQKDTLEIKARPLPKGRLFREGEE